MNKYLIALVFIVLFHSAARSQEKYAVIFSAASIASEPAEKQIAENNVRTISGGLYAQGFLQSRITVFDNKLTKNSFIEAYHTILNKAKRGDVVFFYTDLPIRTIPSTRRISGREFQLVLSRDSSGILLHEIAELIKKAASYTGDENLVFSVFDSEVVAPEEKSAMESELNCAFSCQPGEKKKIVEGVSIYTRALANAFIKGSFAISDYQSLFYGVHREVLLQTTLQHPVLSSNKVEVFNGRFYKNSPYIAVIQKRSDNLFVVNAGESMLLSPGSRVEFYRGKGVRVPELLISSGIVTEVNALTALVKTEKPVQTDISQLSVFIGDSEPAFKILLNTEEMDAPLKNLIERLRNTAPNYFNEVKSGGDLKLSNVRIVNDSMFVQLQNPVSKKIFEEFAFLNNENGLSQLGNLIRTHAVYKGVNNLTNVVPQLDIDWKLDYASGEPVPISNGIPLTYDGDRIKLTLTNNSGSRLYYGMIDMQPDRRINVLSPDKRSTPEESYIEPGTVKTLTFGIAPPFGIEKFKLFTSLQPVIMMEWFRGLSEGRTLTRGSSERNIDKLPEININSLDFEIRNSAFRSAGSAEKISHYFLSENNNQYHAISNPSAGTIFYNVVYQKPDGGFEVILPNKTVKADDCYVKPGDRNTLKLEQKLNAAGLITVYSDRPFNLNDFITDSRSLNDRILEIVRFRHLPGTPIKSVSLLYGFEREIAAERMRGGSDLNIRIVTPKVSLARGGEVETVTPKLEIAGLVFSPGNSLVKQLRINGSPVSYDDKLKLFEHEIVLQTGVNRIVIEATDDKGYVATSSFQVELKSNGNNVVSASGKNYFLGVGINKYQHYDQLKNPVRDVVAFADILQKKFGYDPSNVRLLLDSMATRKNIIGEIRQFLKKTGPNDNVIIYLAGHGNSDPLSDGQYYFLPQEAERSDPAESGLKSTDILDPFRNINAKHCLLIVDACYSGMMTNTEEKLSPLLKGTNESALEEIPSKWILASGLAVPVPDGSGEHSPFALTLMNYLKENNDPARLRINKIQEYLEQIVPQISAQQHPTGKKIDGRGIMIFKVK